MNIYKIFFVLKISAYSGYKKINAGDYRNHYRVNFDIESKGKSQAGVQKGG